MWADILILLAGGFPLLHRTEVVKISDPRMEDSNQGIRGEEMQTIQCRLIGGVTLMLIL